jgi:hypothetical protein
MMPKNGTVPGEDFDVGNLDPAAAEASKGVPEAAREMFVGHFKKAGVRKNGRAYATKTGTCRTDHLARASVTAVGPGSRLP